MIELRVDAGLKAASSLSAIKMLAADFPGEHRIRLLIATSTAGDRRLTLGPEFRYSGSRMCVRALSQFGEVERVTEEE